jgi:hypothetical protein
MPQRSYFLPFLFKTPPLFDSKKLSTLKKDTHYFSAEVFLKNTHGLSTDLKTVN